MMMMIAAILVEKESGKESEPRGGVKEKPQCAPECAA